MQALGLRSQRKPAGFWDDEGNLGGWVAGWLGGWVGGWQGEPRWLLCAGMRARAVCRNAAQALPGLCLCCRSRETKHRLRAAAFMRPRHATPHLSSHPTAHLCLPAADEELTLFVAAHWSKFQDPESRQGYWYNQVGLGTLLAYVSCIHACDPNNRASNKRCC